MKQPDPATKVSPLSDDARDYLFKEYDILKDLYSQSEAAVQSLFNFYLTILSAIIGAIILILQAATLSSIGIVAGLLVFSIVVGIFYQSGIVNKYADESRYARAISELRQYFVKRLPEVASALYELPYKSPVSANSAKLTIERWEQRLWWLFPVGTHQLFIAFMNSLCFSALLWTIVVAIQVVKYQILETGIASFVVFWCSIIANDAYAKIKLQREIDKHTKKMNS